MPWRKLIIEGKKETWLDMTQAEIDKRLSEIAQAEREEQDRLAEEADRQSALARLRLASQNDSQLADLLLTLRLED
jgi:hypothetical protein